MRTIIIMIFAFLASIAARAQAALPVSSLDYIQQGSFHRSTLLNDSNGVQKKWSVSMYSGIGAGFFTNGGGSFFLPSIGAQINRRLNNNLYAFAGVSAGPAFFYPGSSFGNAHLYNNNYMPGFDANRLGINESIHAGLMYVNDAKTFSISGSIGISHNSYPFYPAAQKQPAIIGTRQ